MARAKKINVELTEADHHMLDNGAGLAEPIDTSEEHVHTLDNIEHNPLDEIKKIFIALGMPDSSINDLNMFVLSGNSIDDLSVSMSVHGEIKDLYVKELVKLYKQYAKELKGE